MVGIDLGERRIGVAVSDSAGTVASPRCTIHRSGDREADRSRLVDLVAETGAAILVVGLPVSLDGRRGPAARAAEEEAAALAQLLRPRGVEVETYDERFTTVSAGRRLSEAGHSERSRRSVIDQAAAAEMLQAWLDAHRANRDG